MTREDQLANAGSYALGLLEGAERENFEAALAADPALRAQVDLLTTRLQALDDTVPPAPVPTALWARIEQQLDSAPAAITPEAPPVAAPIPANANIPTGKRQTAAGWMAIAASVVVAGGLGYLLGQSTAPSTEPVVIAVLLNESDASPGAIIEAFADDSVRVVPLDDFEIPAGQILEVWTLPDVETGPVSLGTFTDVENLRLTGPDLPQPADGQLYEITLEPSPGSPTGRPTGPILVKGFAKPPVT